MGPTGQDVHIIQIHPTLRCNLRCLHCYSTSSPEQATTLSLDTLCQALNDAREEGYNAVGVSGGEPLIYPALPELLHHAHSLGMFTTVTTNGLLLSQKRLEALRGAIDLMAISVDGVPESHDRMRNKAGAFNKMKEKLQLVREAGIPFGFIFTLTLYNLHELEWVAAFAVEQGAGLLQMHPLEEVGRAYDHLGKTAPDDLELTYAFLEAARLQKIYGDRLQIQYDAVDREQVRQMPDRLFAGISTAIDAETATQPLSKLVSPIVLEADGTVVPIQYGFSHAFAIGDLKNGTLKEQAAQWKTRAYPDFLSLCQQVFETLTAEINPEMPCTNWYGAVTQGSAHERQVI